MLACRTGTLNNLLFKKKTENRKRKTTHTQNKKSERKGTKESEKQEMGKTI